MEFSDAHHAIFSSSLTIAWLTSQGTHATLPDKWHRSCQKGSGLALPPPLHPPNSYGRQGVCEAVGGVFTTITSDPLFKYSNRKENLRPMGLGVRIRTSQEKSKTSNRISNVNYSSIKKKKNFQQLSLGIFNLVSFHLLNFLENASFTIIKNVHLHVHI